MLTMISGDGPQEHERDEWNVPQIPSSADHVK